LSQTFDTPLFSSDQSIDRVLKAGLPVVLVFLSSTAPESLDQVMKSVAKQDAGKLLVVQLHVKDSPETARKYNIHSAPAIVTLKGSQVQSQAENITSDELQRHASFLLGKGPKPEPRAQPQYSTANAYSGAAYPGGAPSGTHQAPSQQSYSPGPNGKSGAPVAVTDATFNQEVMNSKIPVVVDFWAPWCGPCRMVAPVLDKLAREWNGRVMIAKVNVDENPMIAGQYGISGIPTMMVVKDGKIVDRWAGALPEPAMRSRLSAHIK
jgi:thioredoxin 1